MTYQFQIYYNMKQNKLEDQISITEDHRPDDITPIKTDTKTEAFRKSRGI